MFGSAGAVYTYENGSLTEAENAWVHSTQNLATRFGKAVKAARRLDTI